MLDFSFAIFSDPNKLWLLIPAIAALAVLFLQTNLSIFSSFLRLCWLSLLIFALAKPTTIETHERQKLVALLDSSDSVPLPARRAFLELLDTFATQSAVQIELYEFASSLDSRAQVIHSANIQALKKSSTLKRAAGWTDQTNIEDALKQLLIETEVSSLLLMTDANQTTGAAIEAAKLLANEGVRVYPLVPDTKLFQQNKVEISNLYAPLVVQAGEKANVWTSIRNRTSDEKQANLELWLDDKKIFTREFRLRAGEEVRHESETPIINDGLRRLRAVMRTEGRDEIIQERHRWISVKSKSKFLLISGARDDRRLLSQLISERGYALEEIILDGSAELPAELINYSLIILNNAARRQVGDGFLAKLNSFVRNGGGLLLVGGERAFGLGNYKDTILEEMSPVAFVPPQTTKRRLQNAVVLVIDKSGSMRRDNNIQNAKQAALVAIDAMNNDDFVGVIGFDTNPFLIIKLEPVKDVKPIAARRLENLVAVHGSNLWPALQLAKRMLTNHPAGRKHIIVLTDGMVSGAASVYYKELTDLQREGITLSTIALGREADTPLLRELSRRGSGAFYQTLDGTRLPEIFLRDIKVSTGEKTLQEGTDFPVSIGPASLISTSQRNYPDLQGFVETDAKPGAQHELLVTRSNKNFPLLSSWTLGRGKVAAFTSDASDRWAARWVRWPGFAAFWREIIDSVKPTIADKASEFDFDLRYQVQGSKLILDLALFDETLISTPDIVVKAAVQEPGGERTSLVMQTIRTGKYQAEINDARAGDYKLDIEYAGTKLPPLAITLHQDAFGEGAIDGINVSLLSDLAFITSGSINPSTNEVSAHKRSVTTQRELYPYLLALAFFLLILEALIREWRPSRREKAL